MYQIEDVTSKYSADHITSLGSVNKTSTGRYRMNEVYLMNGINDFDTQASQVTIISSLAGRYTAVKPKTHPRIGSHKPMDSRRRNRGPGIGSAQAVNLGIGFEVKDEFPYLGMDDELKAGVSIVALVFGAYLLWTPITGIIKGGLGVVEKIFDVRAAKKRGDSHKTK
jgi:hypothetical protein